jgi:thioester reductase-like protein
MSDGERVVFVTGWSGFIGRRLTRRLLEELDLTRDRLVLLVRSGRAASARAELEAFGVPGEVLEGDVTSMHLGLSGPEYKSLVADVTEVWHLAALYDLGADQHLIRDVNLEGTRNVLELARTARRLRRLHHFSTAYVSGTRVGVILEEELDVGQRFNNAYEASKFEAEKLVRAAMREVQATVYRPSIVVGDSRTGEIDRFDGPYYLAILLLASPLGVTLPLPGDGTAPLNVVPVDFVVDAALAIARHPGGAGRTVHLVDPAPLSARAVYERIAARAGKALPPVSIPHRAVETLLRVPLLERLARPHRNAIRLVNHVAIYNCASLLELLEGSGLRCPPITSYLDRLVDYVRGHLASPRRTDREEAAQDPLDDAPGPPPS